MHFHIKRSSPVIAAQPVTARSSFPIVKAETGGPSLIRMGWKPARHAFTIGLGCVIAISLFGRQTFAEDACRLSQAERQSFLPKTAAPQNLRPLAAPGEPLPDDCGFYKWAWQAFLFATQPANGKPAFLSLPTYEDVFKVKESPLFADQRPDLLSLAPRRSKIGNKDETAAHLKMDDLLQAGTKEVLVDPQGNVIWYAIHLNRTYQAFIDDYGLRDPKTLDHLPPDLTFRTGSLELKSAWRIVDGPAPKTFISTKAVIPVFTTNAAGEIVRDGGKTRIVTVALLGLHVVGTIEGHPEFIWSTFEHVSHATKAWTRDVAPSATLNPAAAAPVVVETKASAYALYPTDPTRNRAAPRPGANNGNGIYGLRLDAKTQTFTPHSSVYRMFPGSKSDDSNEDDAVTSINADIQSLFEGHAALDVRSHYQLVGAIWLNTPETDFKAGTNFSTMAAAPRKQPLFGGEDRLSSMTMESFTQPSDSFPNCFSCHNTEGVSGLAPSRLNMSHALSKYYSHDEDKL